MARTLSVLTAATVVVSGIPAHADVADDAYVLADISGRIVDSEGRAVRVLDVLGDSQESAEETALVQTSGGDYAVVTTQWRVIREPHRPPGSFEYPTSDSGTHEVGPDGSSVVTEGYNFEELPIIKRADMEVAFVSAVASSVVSLAWAPSAGAREYVVFRDGTEVERTAGPTFLDENVESDSELTYEIVAEVEATDSTEASRSTRTVPISVLSDDAQDFTRSDGSLAPLTYQLYTTAFIYKTFITNQYVQVGAMEAAGCFLSGAAVGDYFGGDNRYYATPGIGAPWTTPSFRTMAFMNVNWDNPAPYDLISAKQVGPTHLYDSSFGLKGTLTASANAIVFQNPSHSGNYVVFGISHEVTNPWCAYGAIRYSLPYVEIYRSGTVSIEGSRQPVPAHEAYARFNTSSGAEVWLSLYQGAQGDFVCLTGVCAAESINASRTY